MRPPAGRGFAPTSPVKKIKVLIKMAIYHFTNKIISRSSDRTSATNAAYRATEKMTNANDGITSNYTRKKGIIHTEVMLPENAPAEDIDKSTL